MYAHIQKGKVYLSGKYINLIRKIFIKIIIFSFLYIIVYRVALSTVLHYVITTR